MGLGCDSVGRWLRWEWPLPASDLSQPRTEDGSEFVLQS